MSCDTGVEEIVVAKDKEKHFEVVFDAFEDRKMQKPIGVDNKKFQQRVYQTKDRLNEEIEEMRKLMVEMSQKGHIEGTQTVNRRTFVTVQTFISKSDEVLQNKIWDLGGWRISVT